MSAPRVALRMNPDVMARIVIWLWLLGLSVAAVLGFRALGQLAEQVHTSVESQQVLALEARTDEERRRYAELQSSFKDCGW